MFPVLVIRTFGNLIKSFFNKLKTPHHSSTKSIRGLTHALVVAAVIGIGFYLAYPHSFTSSDEKNLTSLIVGLIGLGGMIAFQFVLPFILRSFYDEHHWTLGKQVIQSLLMALIVSLGIGYYLTNKSIGNFSFPVDSLILFGYLILPILAFSFIQESFLDKKFSQKAEDLNENLKNIDIKTATNPLKVLLFKGSSEKLSLVPNQLIYAKIASSETEFYYQTMIGVEKKTIGISESDVRKELSEHPQFVKLQNDILLNALAIQKITGSARGYEVAIAKVNSMVKVSSKHRKSIEKL